jgi:hypothetical protein
MSQFRAFVIMYMTGLLLHLVEDWSSPGATLAFLILVSAIAVVGINRLRFLVFLVCASSYQFIAAFPDLANHSNLYLYVSLLLIGGLLVSFARGAQSSADLFFNSMQPLLRTAIIIVYFMAGFHKFNHDFIDPQVGCLNGFLRQLEITLLGTFAGGLMLFTVLLLGLWFALSNAGGWKRFLPFLAGLGLLVCAAVVSGFLSAPESSVSGGYSFMLLVGSLSSLVLFWQLVEGPALFVKKLQAPILVFSLVVHSTLAMIGFVDFQSIALALLLCFVPPGVYRACFADARLRLGRISLHRVHVYLGLNGICGALIGLHTLYVPFLEPRSLSGLVFNGSVIVLLWPLLTALVSENRQWQWRGVSVWPASTPRLLLVFPVLLVLWGMTSYLGLRTAGNFSMFSNLRTEGVDSNHILLGGNPLKIWDYQEDAITLLVLAPEHRSSTLQEQFRLPMVEFRKAILSWQQRGDTVAVQFYYRGELVYSPDITRDPRWKVDQADWAMRLLDFRPIQFGGANHCRW